MANATDKQGGPFIYAEGQNDAGQPDDTVSVSAHFVSRAESVIEDLIHNAELQHRATCWHKGMNSDLVDSKHASYLTDAVNEDDVDHPDLNDSSPVAPSGGLNVKWQVATAQNTDSQTPVSAYVPFSSISTATAVSTDYVVITDTSDSNNPKRALVSDIATATLSGIGSGTPVAADTFVFVDADDGVAKKGSAADTLVALGAAPSATAVTAASTLADNEVPKIDGASRAVQASGVYIEDISGSALHVHGPDNASPVVPTAFVLRSGNATGGTVDSGNTIIDTGTSGGGTAGTVQVGVTTANAVSLGRSGKNTQVNGTLGVTGAATCSSTLASGAHTETVANATASNRSGVDNTKGPWRQTYFKDMTTSGGGVQTVMDVPIPTSCSATIAVRLYTIAPSSLNRVFLAVHELHVSDNAGTVTIQLDQPIIDNDPAGIGYAISFTVSTTNVRIQINDATNTLRLGCSATIEWRNSTA